MHRMKYRRWKMAGSTRSRTGAPHRLGYGRLRARITARTLPGRAAAGRGRGMMRAP